MTVQSIDASCHCGAVRLQLAVPFDEVRDCNCSICRRYGVLWAYYAPSQVQVTAPQDGTEIYVWGEKLIEFHRCSGCGCVSHWRAVDKAIDRMGVNARLTSPDVLARARVHRFDGADTWKIIE